MVPKNQDQVIQLAFKYTNVYCAPIIGFCTYHWILSQYKGECSKRTAQSLNGCCNYLKEMFQKRFNNWMGDWPRLSIHSFPMPKTCYSNYSCSYRTCVFPSSCCIFYMKSLSSFLHLFNLYLYFKSRIRNQFLRKPF